MRNAGEHGLVHMPPVDQCFASLALSPDEALKEKCPLSQATVPGHGYSALEGS